MHERDARRPAHHEPELRRLVHDLVEGDAGEVRELQLDDRPQAREGGADPAADEAALGERRVADALEAEPLLETLGGAEDPADGADVLAHQDHVRVGLELELERLADGGDEAERRAPSRPRAPDGSAAVRARRGGGRRDPRPGRRARSRSRSRPRARRRARSPASRSSSSSPSSRSRPSRRGSGSFASHSATSAASRVSGRFARMECCMRRKVFISRSVGP